MGMLLSLVLVGGGLYAAVKIGLAVRKGKNSPNAFGSGSTPTMRSNMAWMGENQPLAERGRGGYGKPPAGRGIEAVVGRALAELRLAVQRNEKDCTIVVQPSESDGPSLGMFLGQVAERVQSAGYIINWADTRNGVGIIKVWVPSAMLDGSQRVP
jgi:hypothetical protein